MKFMDVLAVLNKYFKKNPITSTFTAFFASLLCRYCILRIYRKWKRYPPGPIGWPIIGSIPSFAIYSDQFLIHLASKYPLLSCIQMGTRTMISINDRKLAKKILSKVWAINKSEGLVPKNYPIAFDMLSGAEWTRRRKVFHERITQKIKAEDIGNVVNRNMSNIDMNKLWYPRETMVKIMFCLFFNVLFGDDGSNDSVQEQLKKEEFQQIVPKYIGRHAFILLINLISQSMGNAVMKMTGFGWTYRMRMTQMINEWQIKYKNEQLPISQISDMVVTFFAGTDTTGVALDACIVHLAKYPHLQKVIREDESGVMLNAFIYELLRVMPAVPLGLPHFVAEEVMVDVSENEIYCIPKDCFIHINIVGMNYNSKTFADAHKFDIYRWLTKNENDEWIFEKKNGSDLTSFSYGKRDCVGKNLAKRILQIALTQIIERYEFSFDDGVDPKDVDVRFGMDLTYHIDPQIGVRIKPRMNEV